MTRIGSKKRKANRHQTSKVGVWLTELVLFGNFSQKHMMQMYLGLIVAQMTTLLRKSEFTML
jgi:hypothetical protein